jgi:hypothetical protein
MATNGLDAVPDPKTGQSPPETRSPRSASGPKDGSDDQTAPRRRRDRKEAAEAHTVERFFLAEANGGANHANAR